MPVRIRICNQLGLSFQKTPENVSIGHGWFLSNFPPHKANYPPFWVTTLHKKTRKKVSILLIVLILCSRSMDIIDTKFFRYLPSLEYSHPGLFNQIYFRHLVFKRTRCECSFQLRKGCDLIQGDRNNTIWIKKTSTRLTMWFLVETTSMRQTMWYLVKKTSMRLSVLFKTMHLAEG